MQCKLLITQIFTIDVQCFLNTWYQYFKEKNLKSLVLGFKNFYTMTSYTNTAINCIYVWFVSCITVNNISINSKYITKYNTPETIERHLDKTTVLFVRSSNPWGATTPFSVFLWIKMNQSMLQYITMNYIEEKFAWYTLNGCYESECADRRGFSRCMKLNVYSCLNW